MHKTEIGIGLLGFGTVGQGLVQGIHMQAEEIRRRLGVDLRVRKALVQDLDKERIVGGPQLTINPEEVIFDPEIDIIVEVMGNEHPTYAYLKQALRRRKHVVTANKLLLALHGAELQELARQHAVSLLYEGSVMGGVPILRTIQRGLSGDQVQEVRGILNGTTNFILSRMAESGEEYETALHLAQEAGYAESDPTMDVSGLDAACKLVILCRECFGIEVGLNQVEVGGIQSVDQRQIRQAREQGLAPKLIAQARMVPATTEASLEAKVGVEWVSDEDPLSHVVGVANGLALHTLLVGDLFWSGPGAGGLATGGAVLADVMEAAEHVLTERRFSRVNTGK